jgi:hypothetical protein
MRRTHSPANSRRVTARSCRSRVTNGRTLLAGVDGRSAGARRYRDVLADVMEQTGRRNEALCRRYASLVMQSETLDAMIARGETVTTDEVVKLSGELRRVMSRLGLIGYDEDEPAPLPADAPAWLIGEREVAS